MVALLTAGLFAGLSTGLFSGCASKRRGTPDNEPTIKTLAGREAVVAPDPGIPSDADKTIAAYRKFLDVAPAARQRPEAMRRLGDLEMDSADNRLDSGKEASGTPDYRAAIKRYQDYLTAYPKDPGNDRILYQLARAHEQSGSLEVSLQTLDRLVQQYPNTHYRDEAEFRRGELLFTTRDYVHAEQAYAAVLGGDSDNPYRERALYMQGWSRFKQGRLDDALQPFFGVLDLGLKGREGEGSLDTIQGLSRADRELIEDTFRVVSLCLEGLQGVETIPALVTTPVRRDYEFRVYEQLGALYIKQGRVKDAADTFAAFTRRHPSHPQAPLLQAQVIEIYQQAGFDNLALQGKKDYVASYGAGSELRRANPQAWERAQPLVKTHLSELARRYHASAQKSKSSADYQEAVRWYRAELESFPNDAQAPQSNFLLAELLFEDSHYKEAATEYEKTAYDYPRHERSADAGYAALLSYAEQEKRAAAADALSLQRTGIDSGLRFADKFPDDARTAAVLANAADKLYALHDNERASGVAKRVLALKPPAADAQRRVALTVVAQTAFEAGAYDRAESAYGEVIALTPATDRSRSDLVERLAASVYKQGEQARADGRPRDAASTFSRVITVAPQSSVRAAAQYDAAAELIGLKDWDGATRSLEDFRQRYPNHPLSDEVAAKLALAYTEKAQWAQAAAEYERLAVAKKDPQLSRDALWQAAELYEKAGSRANAAGAYERYLRQNPESLEPAVEARYRLARIAKADGNAARELSWMKEVLQADQAGGNSRTPRTRFLGATAALAVAEPVFEDYRKVALVEPLQKQLKLKKAKLEDVLKAYNVASAYGVAEVTTAATYRSAALYQDFGKAMLTSQRPKRLSKTELEQYNVLLEEQAFPFEEKATELHELNARRSADGVYDAWVKQSYAALRELRPVRYGKSERNEAGVERDQPVNANPKKPAEFNQLGISYRQQGQFTKAREAYEQAIALDEHDATAVLNLGILNDLYLWDLPQALALYERYLAMTPAGDATVTKWVADIKNRKPETGAMNQKEKP